MAGATAALEYFGVPDPETRVDEYADRKQEMVVELIEAGKFSAYPDALRFVIAVKDAGMKIAAASSSKNAGLFLRQIRLDTFAEEEGLSPAWMTSGLTLLDAFDVDISGREFAQGKPHPEIFLTAAQRARRRARRTRSSSRTPSRASRRRRRATSPRSASRATTTRRCWPARDADIVVAVARRDRARGPRRGPARAPRGLTADSLRVAQSADVAPRLSQ